MRYTLSFLAFTGLALSGCATSYNPAEVCTAQWIEPRVERAVGYIERDTNSLLKTLSKNAKSFEQGKTPNPFQIFAITSAVTKLTKQLESGQGVKDLKILRQTCNDSKIVSDALTGYMEDKGLPTAMISFITSLKAYQNLLTDEPVSPRGATTT
ncbi:MAG: hypothetical protein ACSHXY_11730 [Alphaproteobacteria bacterium]